MKTQNILNKKSPGRPRAFDQHKLHFFVFVARVRAELTASLGKPLSDLAVLNSIIEAGGHRYWVAADRDQLGAAQSNLEWMDRNPRIAKLRIGDFGTRAHERKHLKTLCNFYDRCKQEAIRDPTFIPFANQILAEYGLADRPEPVGGAGWRPSLRIWN